MLVYEKGDWEVEKINERTKEDDMAKVIDNTKERTRGHRCKHPSCTLGVPSGVSSVTSNDVGR